MARYILLLCVAAATAMAGPSANDKLKQCCAGLKDADKECVSKFCDFDAISQANILNYLGTCSERGPTVGKMWDCASLRHDHTDCCKAKGVEGKCLEYCSAQDGVPTNYLDYAFCTESFNEIRTCFYEHLEKNPAFGKGKSRRAALRRA